MDAYRSLRESDCIVRAVAAENDNWFLAIFASTEEHLNVILLVGGLASRTYIVIRDAKLERQTLNSSVIIARDDMY